MVEIIVTIALEVAKCLAPSARSQVGYLRNYKSNFENLKTEVEKLKDKRTSIQHEVDAAKRNGAEIEANVQKWLDKASEIINEDAAKSAEDEKVAAKMRCCKGWYPDLKARYRLSKEAVMQLEAVVKHLEAGIFDSISYRTTPKDPRLSNEDYEAFQSRKPTLTNIISSLTDPDVNIVGIYGMGGIGKTMLAKEVAKQLDINKLFDSVIFVEIRQNTDTMKIQREIQKEIAGRLGLRLSQEETGPVIASNLYRQLKAEKKILIILDNIWDHLDLQAIGIPLADEHKGCKVLLTARSVDVLAGKMDSQRNFAVDFLDNEEAWNLFKKITGNYIEGEEFKSIATEIVNKCARLPIVIVTIARALRNKGLFVWEDDLQQMRMSSQENIPNVRASMELSYNHLESEVLKKTILLIRYANITAVDQLLMYGMGLGLFDGISKMEARRVRVRRLVQQLKDSWLLLDSNTADENFSMHDVVRDSIISIASRDGHVFTNELSDKLELPGENTLKHCPSIVLKDVERGELPEVMESSQLKLLSISTARSRFSLEIHDLFFTRMTELRVLVLANMNLSPVPASLRLLTNLRALGLHNCQLVDIAIIGDLKKLEMLSLKNSEFKQLPAEVGHLTQLKSLDLRHCFHLYVIPPNVLSSLSHLEELYIADFVEWGREWEGETGGKESGKGKYGKNVCLDELKHLRNLTCLEIQIKNAETIPSDMFFGNLVRYKIAIECTEDCTWDDNRHWNWDFTSPNSDRKFKISHNNTNIFLSELQGIEDLCLVGLQNMKSVINGLDVYRFRQLKYLQVRDNFDLLSIVDLMKCATYGEWVFPCLESLLLKNLIQLEKICCGQLRGESFSQLRRIKVEECYKLENLFSFSVAIRLQLLQSIEVIYCNNMKEIFATEREDEANNNSEVIDNIELSQLHSLTLYFLPKLRGFSSKFQASSKLQQRPDEIILENNNNVSYALFNEVELPNLKVLELYHINVEKIWQKKVVATMSSSIENLTRLVIGECNNLRCLFLPSMIRSLVQLQHLEIFNCPVLEVIIDMEGPNFKEPRKFPSFHKLKTVSIVGCDRLKNVFPASVACSLSQLESLDIKNCGVEEIFFVADEGAETSSRFASEGITPFDDDGLREEEGKSNVAFPISNIENCLTIQVACCHKLKTLFPQNMYRKFLRLESVSVTDCASLEVIFDLESPNFEDEHSAVTTQLSELLIHGLPRLKHVWNKDHPKFVFFQKLNTLGIVGCDRLKNVFPMSVARSLSQLKSLEIRRCGMEEIVFVADEEVETNDYEIVFKELKVLQLSCLESLTSFCSANYTFEFPSLEDIIVEECPKMRSFSGGELSTPKLQKVKRNWRDRGFWMGDLNTTMKELHEEIRIERQQ